MVAMPVINYSFCIILVTYIHCYRAAESFNDANATEKSFKSMEQRLNYLEERIKQFDNFKQTTENQNDIFRNTIAYNQETIEENKNTIAELKGQLNNALIRIAELESKHEKQYNREFNNQLNFREADEDRSSLDEINNTTHTTSNVHVREIYLVFFEDMYKQLV